MFVNIVRERLFVNDLFVNDTKKKNKIYKLYPSEKKHMNSTPLKTCVFFAEFTEISISLWKRASLSQNSHKLAFPSQNVCLFRRIHINYFFASKLSDFRKKITIFLENTGFSWNYSRPLFVNRLFVKVFVMFVNVMFVNIVQVSPRHLAVPTSPPNKHLLVLILARQKKKTKTETNN